MKAAFHFRDIVGRYSALFCDVWGVIRDGHAILPDAIQALQETRATGVPVILVSNSPRPAHDVSRQLSLMGAPDDAWDGIVTSGDATRIALKEQAPGPFFKIGPPGGDDLLYDGLDIAFSDVDEARAIVCTGLVRELGSEPEDYEALLTKLADRQLPMICANPDIVVQVGDDLVWCAGALARLYRELSGTSVIAGKPHKPIYELAYRMLLDRGWKGDRKTVLVIGDGPETDLAGAARNGVDSLFIGDGILGGDLNPSDLSAVAEELAHYNASATWFAPRLIW
ncbi:TIGR01459 family HAD-type hydrolase [Hyphobacterium sp.]|uniref:TIGR01459 family HAD-type hydrolase n=1 Tax=Hyphobacterium sp. TaxID=2004662 RepID=UPI0037497553